MKKIQPYSLWIGLLKWKFYYYYQWMCPSNLAKHTFNRLDRFYFLCTLYPYLIITSEWPLFLSSDQNIPVFFAFFH